MANLSVTVQRVGGDLKVNGTAVATVTVQCSGTTVTVTPNGSGEYSATLPGLGGTNAPVNVTAGDKVVNVVLPPPFGGLSMPTFLAGEFVSLTGEHLPTGKLQLSGTFQRGHARPFTCTHNELGVQKAATVTGDTWTVTFDANSTTDNTFTFDM